MWAFNWDITLTYWAYLFPLHPPLEPFRAITNHSIPLILTLIDFSMNKIVFVRVQFAAPILTLIGYGLLVLMPFSLEVKVIYPGIDFKGWLSYVLLIGLVVFGIIVLEIGKLVKEKAFKENSSDLKNSLI